MLEEARIAAGSVPPRWDDARILGELAEAGLDDLTENPSSSIPDIFLADYDAARDFSRKFNDAFSRTYTAKITQKGRAGEPRMPPDLIMLRAFSTGKEVGELHLRQLEDAARFAGPEHLSRLMEQQEGLIRVMAGKLIDRNTGRVDAGRLDKFIRENTDSGLFERFPEIREQLTSATKAEKLLLATERGTRNRRKFITEQSAIAKVLKFEDPVIAVAEAISSNEPTKAYRRIANLAKSSAGGQDAIDGLVGASFERSFRLAKKSDGSLSFTDYRAALLEAPKKGNRPLIDLMIENQLISKQHKDTLIKFLDKAADLETAMLGGELIDLDSALGSTGMLPDLVIRLAGADFLTRVSVFNQAHPLIVGEAGSRMFRTLFEKIPIKNRRDFLISLVKDPEAMANVLQTPKSRTGAIKLFQRMNAFLWQTGLIIRPSDGQLEPISGFDPTEFGVPQPAEID
jgi:hypothetical protein